MFSNDLEILSISHAYKRSQAIERKINNLQGFLLDANCYKSFIVNKLSFGSRALLKLPALKK